MPFDKEILTEIANKYGTPVFIYDEANIKNRIDRVNKSFDWADNYLNYFAVKATPTPAILKTIYKGGMGFDCSSFAELKLIENNIKSNLNIFYTSNNTSNEDYIYAHKLKAIINIDKRVYLKEVINALSCPPDTMSIRYNPGKIESANMILGQPKESKFGDTKKNCLLALKHMKQAGIKRLGLHSMSVSNCNSISSFKQTAQHIKDLILEAYHKLDIKIDFVNLGGGLGINYYKDQKEVEIEKVAKSIKDVLGGFKISIFTEYGRYITGPCGYLLTRVTHGVVESYKTFLTVDTSVNNLNRLATVSNVHHEITAVNSPSNSKKEIMTIVGSMCTDNDKMFKDYKLPADIKRGDLLIIHDVGAHGRADATNYNGQLRCGEVLIKENGSDHLIRRHETIDDLFATTNKL